MNDQLLIEMIWEEVKAKLNFLYEVLPHKDHPYLESADDIIKKFINDMNKAL